MESNETPICPLCRHEKVKIWAAGDCAHPVCHLCSTKMRILCEQTYCAICRQELPRVYFASNLAELQTTVDQSRFTPIDDIGDCGIYYPIKAEWIRRDAEKLLRNFCPSCHTEFETFDVLRDHVKRAHNYIYCDLCVEHLNLFPFERKCYTRRDLAQHIRYGDRDDTSFKGHPLCKFCDDHFLDTDQLYKHMRKEHYYCHLCTSDNVYYSDFDLLRDHFRTSHYLCEIDQCKDVQFTNVFSSETDFRAHQAAQHSKNRAHARQLGTLAVEFQSSSMRDRRQQRDPAHRGVFKSGHFDTQGNNNSTRNEREDTQTEPAVAAAVPSINEFPTLGDRSSTPQNLSQRGAWLNDQPRGINSYTDFPTLPNAAGNLSNTSQPRGIWREQQSTISTTTSSSSSSSSAAQNTASKKVTQSNKQTANGETSLTAKEDFPALQGAVNTRIPPPVSMISAWTKAKKSTKTANAKANQPQMRMNTNRLLNDDDDEEYIRRPMASLTTSTVPTASSNITMISSSHLSNAQSNDKQNKAKNQSVPNAQDFPALPSTNTTQNTVNSGVWTAVGTSSSPQASSTKQKKKNSATSKKKFMEELQSAAPALSSTDEFPAIGLSELGQRLITEEIVPTTQVKEEKRPSPVQPSQSAKKDNSSTNQPKKKTQKSPKTNEPIKEESSLPSNKNSTEPINNQASSQIESTSQPKPSPPSSVLPPPPPGFTVLPSVPPPPGFNSIPTPQPATYHFPTSYGKRKNDFHMKLFDLFDGDMNLFSEYDKFCDAFSQEKISTTDFLTYTKQLFKDKLDEYLLELIVIIPNIDQQNELYKIWKTDIHPSSTAKSNSSGWTNKKSDENNIYVCRLCQQIMFDSDSDEHNSSHPEFNTQFPSLPAAALPLGRASGKKKK
ncbi:unnamed protein product [Adineta ricciae]|uniref:RING-type E3 ubiquitin transferase n=1 Tax=Adineta ricciae TaxID=249248 RepID=A0A816DCH0_ADIRI|nr:unnamed protein product [Adineta ricciae]